MTPQSLRRSVLFALIAIASALPAAAASANDFSIEVLIDGRPLTEYASRGATYIEASESREYAIRLRNNSNERVAVALSVDGLNSIDARKTSARDAAKWILGPYETITVDGWQTGDSTARRFFFTTEDRSYGSWLGETDDLGIVAAAFFREKRSAPAPYTRRKSGRSRPRADAAPGESKMDRDAAAESLSDEAAATGIGREIEHRVRRVAFRAQSEPAALLQVRYEYRDALISLGVLPRPRTSHDDTLRRRARARGFSDSPFSPDPFRGR